jgi:GDPmannose 4,6-dehydratase
VSTVRVLVTGASGQDGSYLVEQLLAEGAEVHALVRPGEEPGAGVHPLPAEVHQHEGDLRDGAALEALVAEVAPTEIYNLGGLSSVALSWQEPALTAQISGLSVGHLLQAAHDLQERSGGPVSFVQASSAEIFARTARVPQDETTPLRPLSPYGAAKAYAHHLVGVYRAQGLRACSCVLYNHESPRRPETFVTRKITAGVARIARGLQDELAMGNLDARRDWGWAPDYVQAMVLAARADRGRDYVVATGVSHSVRDFVEAAFRAAGIDDWERRVTLDQRFVRPNDAPELVGDASRARELLGWQPQVHFEEVVARMVRHDLALIDGAGESPSEG